jgi:hypothetical protein
MNELWVARDEDQKGGLFIFQNQPQLSRGYFRTTTGWLIGIDARLYPNRLPGQCRRLVMESEASE